jgi:putative flippase GtrA
VNNEIAKYGISGALAFICDFTVLYYCTEFLDMHYLASNALGYISGLLVAYVLNVNWVFSYRKYKRTWLEFLIFNTIVLAGLAISEVMMAFLVDISGIHYLIAKIVASFFVMVFNYTAKKYILFHPTPAHRQP